MKGLDGTEIFVGYHLLQNNIINRLQEIIQRCKVNKHRMRNIEHINYFQAFEV